MHFHCMLNLKKKNCIILESKNFLARTNMQHIYSLNKLYLKSILAHNLKGHMLRYFVTGMMHWAQKTKTTSLFYMGDWQSQSHKTSFWYGMQREQIHRNKNPISENWEHTKNNTDSKWVSLTGSLTCLETFEDTENIFLYLYYLREYHCQLQYDQVHA